MWVFLFGLVVGLVVGLVIGWVAMCYTVGRWIATGQITRNPSWFGR